MNGFQNKKSACLIRLRHPVFLFPCPPNLLSKDFPESHKNGSLSIVGVGFVKIPPQFYEKGPFYV